VLAWHRARRECEVEAQHSKRVSEEAGTARAQGTHCTYHARARRAMAFAAPARRGTACPRAWWVREA